MPEQREIDSKDLLGYLRWALEHVNNARLVARDLNEPFATQKALEEAEKQLQIARATSIEQAEHREYVRGEVPADQKCGDRYQYGRRCALRQEHKSERHRDGEISWTPEMSRRWKEGHHEGD